MFRKLLLATALLFLFLLLVVHSGWNLFNLNDGLKNLLESKVRAIAGENFSVDKFKLGFGSLKLEGVKLVFDDAPYEIWIKELRLGYSIGSLLRGDAIPAKTAEEITIHNPRLTLLFDSKKAKTTDVNLSLDLSNEAERLYRSMLKEYDFIKRITISDGEIEIVDTSTGTRTELARRINGWAYTDENGKAWLRLAGHLFTTDEYNMVMYGQLDLNRGGLDYVNVDLHDYHLGNEIPFLIPDYLDVLSGLVNGHLTITERRQPTRGFNLEGTVKLVDGRFKVATENLYLEDVNIEAEISDWNIEITSATQNINGSPFSLEGSIDNILDPQLDLHLTSTRVDVARFLKQFLPEKSLPFTGTTALDVTMTDALNRPKIRGTLNSDSLLIFQNKLRNLDVEIGLNNSSLTFSEITGTIDDVTITGIGRIDFLAPEKPINFDINIAGDWTEVLHRFGLTSVTNCSGTAELKAFGPLDEPISTGKFELDFSNGETETPGLVGSLRYNDGRIAINASSTDGEFSLSASIDNIHNTPTVNLDATNLDQILRIANISGFGFLQKRYRLNMTLEGEWRRLLLSADVYRRDNYEKILRLDANADHGVVDGTIAFLPNSGKAAKGKFKAEWRDDRIKISHLNVEDWLTGALDFSRSDMQTASGNLSLSGLDLSLLMAILGKTDADAYRGKLYGRIEVGGDRTDAEVTANIWLLEGFLHDLGPIKGEIDLSATDSAIVLKKLTVNADSFDLIAKGQYDIIANEISGAIAGSHVRVEDVLLLLTGQEDIVKGNATIQVSVKGKPPKLPLYGSVVVHNTKILKLAFDEVLLDFGSESEANGSYISANALHVGRAQFSKGQEFTLTGTAHLPLKDGQGVNLDLSGDGNFLALLPDLAELFTKTSSEGHLDLRMAGHYKRPDFTGSHLNFSAGELHLSSVVKKVENVEGEMDVLADDYFLDIKKLRGTVDNREITISNTNDMNSLGRKQGRYQPLRVGGDDLNLGAILVSVSPKGIPLNIPGLMEEGDVGWFEFKGYMPRENLFITGPWRRPVVRGKVIVRNANMMFPFDEGVGDGNPVVMNIMNNIDWDLQALAGKDASYVRQFPAGMFVDIDITKGAHLEFKGILKDSTFTIGGLVESTRGEIEYLDLNFRVEKMGVEFNPASLYPMVYGRAYTVLRDSTNVPSDVYLTLFTVDDINQELDKGRWDRVNIKLSSQYPTYDQTQSQIMRALGYSSETIDDQARKVVGSSTDNMLFRPLLRPIERELERKLQLDLVRFSYAITQNFLDSSFNSEQLGPSLALLRSSRLMLGKYLTEDVYLLYTGELKAGIDYQFQDKGYGLLHVVGLEYRLNPKWLLQMEYDYNTLFETHKDDKKLWLRHSFPF